MCGCNKAKGVLSPRMLSGLVVKRIRANSLAAVVLLGSARTVSKCSLALACASAEVSWREHMVERTQSTA